MEMETFELERQQSLWEHKVDINLSESGVDPLTLDGLAALGLDLDRLHGVPLEYIQSNGTPELRSQLAGHYAGATTGHVLVTTGSSEANYVAVQVLVEPGDEVVAIVPANQERLFERARRMMRANRESFRDWTGRRNGALAYREPRAGAFAFAPFFDNGRLADCAGFAERLRRNRSVLLVAGRWAGMPGYLRFGLGLEPGPFAEGLRRVGLEIRRNPAGCPETDENA